MLDFIVDPHQGWMLAITLCGTALVFLIAASSIWFYGPREKSERKEAVQHLLLRLVLIDALIMGGYYILWRILRSMNPEALWFAVPLVLVEIYAYIDVALFTLNMWPRTMRKAPAPRGDERVDVFIPTYNEPPELVLLTAQAAIGIDWPNLEVYILDDGNRQEMKKLAEKLGCHYITRGQEWAEKPLHAKAGNINNALLETSGEFILILDADQIPDPKIIKRTVGYFRNEKLAFVQTPQYFYNLFPNDPFGNDAPIFYGPILSGRDGWNAAFFCGSNAVLRREALMQLGLIGFASDMEKQVNQGLRDLYRDILEESQVGMRKISGLPALRKSLNKARKASKAGKPIMEISQIIRDGLATAETEAALEAMEQVRNDLEQLAAEGDANAKVALEQITHEQEDLAVELAHLQALTGEHALLTQRTLAKLESIRGDEAIPVMALSTISITEDIATALRLHALGWESAFHSEILAYGLAPEDLGAALAQRLRWAEGNVKVLLTDNPLLMKGLNFPQRLMYFNTLYNYLGGFANLIFLLTPAVYLFTLISPLVAFSAEFLWRLLPYLVITKLGYAFAARGLSMRRSEYFNTALFALWIRAVIDVMLNRSKGFVVTPKQRQSGNFLGLIWPQIAVMSTLILAIGFGIWTLLTGSQTDLFGVLGAMIWGSYYVYILSTLVRAALFKAPPGWDPKPPAFLFEERG